MWTLVRAELQRRFGRDPGPRVRPRVDRYRIDEDTVRTLREQGCVPVLDVGATVVRPSVLVTMDRGEVDGVGEARIGADYVRAVLRAGGRPVLVPPGEAQLDGLLAAADALVITGGAFDIHPRHYGQVVSARIDRVEEARTEMELALARAALARGLPVLGVCGGMQVLAVAAGGSLIQDLPAEPAHEQPTDPAEPWHTVCLEGRLAAWLGAEIRVNSTHHQAVDRPGPPPGAHPDEPGFDVAGRSPDGVIEAMIHPRHPFAVGVQWHPERLGDLRLYTALIEAVGADAARVDGAARR